MLMIFFDENKEAIQFINGDFHNRPFVEDIVVIKEKRYRVRQVEIDYYDDKIVVYVTSE